MNFKKLSILGGFALGSMLPVTVVDTCYSMDEQNKNENLNGNYEAQSDNIVLFCNDCIGSREEIESITQKSNAIAKMISDGKVARFDKDSVPGLAAVGTENGVLQTLLDTLARDTDLDGLWVEDTSCEDEIIKYITLGINYQADDAAYTIYGVHYSDADGYGKKLLVWSSQEKYDDYKLGVDEVEGELRLQKGGIRELRKIAKPQIEGNNPQVEKGNPKVEEGNPKVEEGNPKVEENNMENKNDKGFKNVVVDIEMQDIETIMSRAFVDAMNRYALSNKTKEDGILGRLNWCEGEINNIKTSMDNKVNQSVMQNNINASDNQLKLMINRLQKELGEIKQDMEKVAKNNNKGQGSGEVIINRSRRIRTNQTDKNSGSSYEQNSGRLISGIKFENSINVEGAENSKKLDDSGNKTIRGRRGDRKVVKQPEVINQESQENDTGAGNTKKPRRRRIMNG